MINDSRKIDGGNLSVYLRPEYKQVEVYSTFFRNSFLGAYAGALEELIADKNHLNVLCIPCAGGEEVYSVNMIHYCAPLHDYTIKGVDLDKTSIENAVKGSFDFGWSRIYYPMTHFKVDNCSLCFEKYFSNNFSKLTKFIYEQNFLTTVQLPDFLRKNVEFECSDILSINSEKFDVIFCQNFLYYFNYDGMKIIAEKIKALVKDNGLVCFDSLPKFIQGDISDQFKDYYNILKLFEDTDVHIISSFC